MKNRLISDARLQTAELAKRRGQTKSIISDLERLFDPQGLTIGVARRFAPYERAELNLKDLDFLARLITDSEPKELLLPFGAIRPPR